MEDYGKLKTVLTNLNILERTLNKVGQSVTKVKAIDTGLSNERTDCNTQKIN